MVLAQILCDRIFVIHQGRRVADVIQRFGQGSQTMEVRLVCPLNPPTLATLRASFRLLELAYKESSKLMRLAIHPRR